MPYITIDDIKTNRIPEARLIELTDEQRVGIVDEAKVTGAIDGAAEIFEGFVRGRYPLPLDPVPGIARTINLDLATYAIYGLNPDFEPPKAIADRYTTAMKLLERIQDGKMKLYDDEPQVTVETGGGSEVVSANRTFTRDTLKGF